jgi:hypothetical protein
MRGTTPRGIFHSYLVLTLVGLIVGPLIIFKGIHANHRDRPSLEWPKVSGKIMQCDKMYHSGSRRSNGTYSIEATYTYTINHQHYVEHQITLWNPNLMRKTGNFILLHPVSSPVDVYYDPQNPANAVLIPGADEAGNRFTIICGCILFACGMVSATMLRPAYAKYKVQRQQEKTARHMHKPPKPASLPHGFASYEPGNKRKLNVFPDKDALMQVLGHDDGKPLQEWQPEDRVIDTAGREYRLRKDPEKKYYDLDATGETWNCERLLGVAEADGKLLKKNPEVMRHRLDGVPESEKMAVVMKSIDELPAGPRWVLAGFILFLILFFVVITFVVGTVVIWVIDHWPQ